jgi:hypothetical protein
MLRTTKVTVWVPPIPPWLATTGRKTARATTFVIVSSKRLTITAAKKAVARLMYSQGSLLRRELVRGPAILSPPTLAIRNISSVASSATTPIRSSARTTPANRPSPSTTGSRLKL